MKKITSLLSYTLLIVLILPSLILMTNAAISEDAKEQEKAKEQEQQQEQPQPPQGVIESGIASYDEKIPEPEPVDPLKEEKFHIFPPTHMQHIHMISGFNTGTVTVWCQSKDTNFGKHDLPPHQYFWWKFHPGLFGLKATLYWCHWYWGNRHVKHEAYNEDQDADLCAYMPPGASHAKTFTCRWEARPDGIYFTKNPTALDKDPSWQKKFDWDPL